ncbi:VanZ family protein [Hymenobacter sp. BT730]|uniref:VanZ family protein n=1 Tax=Hymenobacter sp. BT730 TaxID=3063332 RepID=UPI0026E111AF|nr:VanZ family protein [Hymenobacter sp. BT730]
MYPAPPTSRPRAYAALPATWAVVILVLTLTPKDHMPPEPHWQLFSFYTAAHAFVFWVLAILCYFSTQRQARYPWLRTHAFLLLFVACTLFGSLIELTQLLMNLGRYAEWTDVLSDALGTLTGLVMAKMAMRRFM